MIQLSEQQAAMPDEGRVRTLQRLSDLQLGGLIHEAERIAKELADILSTRFSAEEQELFEKMNEEITVLLERLDLERARRSWVNLQAVISNLTGQSGDQLMEMVTGLYGMPDSPDERQESHDSSHTAE